MFAYKLCIHKCRCVLALAVVVLLGMISGQPAISETAPAGTVIKNQATGTFEDPLSQTTNAVESNEVLVTLAEVAGITITPANTPIVMSGSVANFDFTVTNIGNDPTQFFLPTAASNVTGGLPGTLQVIGYIPAGGTIVNLATPINVTTAVSTGGLSDPTIGGNTVTGSIPANAAIVVRVPVTVNAAAGAPVSVTLGNTTGQPSNTNTAYVAQSNDLYTIDNADGVSGEFVGIPINGDVTNHRQEASAIQSVTAIGVDYGDAPDGSAGTGAGNYKTVGSDGGAVHQIISGLNLGAIVDADSGSLQNAAADADDTNGSPNDEDGVTSFPPLSNSAGKPYQISANVTNTTGSDAYLVGYIDFNQDGDFNDPNEQSTPITVNASGAQTLTFTTPAGMTPGTAYVRLRLSKTLAEVNSPIGFASSGEVEDYRLPIVASTLVDISGKVWQDLSGDSLINGTEPGTDAGSSNLTVYAVNSSGNVIAKSDVAADGTYTLSVPPNTSNITLRLLNNSSIAINSPAPSAPSLPTGWGNTGENQNGTPEASVLGDIPLSVTTTNVPSQNFGVDQFPLPPIPGSPGSPAICATGVTLNAKVFLSGAYVSASGLMRDDLRTKGLIPLTDPYQGLGFSHGPGGGGETTTAAVLATSGNNAIVDWVFLELRSTTSQIVATRSALVQSDGDIVSSTDGVSGVKFDVPPGDYYVVVKHRNHLAVMTDAKVTFGATAANVDFTAASLGIYNSDPAFDGTERRVLPSSTLMGLWPGDANRDNQIVYTGIAREIWAIKGQVYSDLGNTGSNASYISNGYHLTDLDLKGSTIFQGPGNDVDVIFFPVLTHPKNTTFSTSFVIPGQLPTAATILPQSLCSGLSVNISGKVWQDLSGDSLIDATEPGTDAGSSNLTVYAVNSSGTVIAKSDVAADGTYSLSVPQNTSNIKLRLLNDSSIAINSPAPSTPSLPTGWGNTGENQNGTPEASVLGEIPLSVTTTNVPSQNFGVDQFPPAPIPGSPGSPALCATDVTLNAKVFLSGAYVSASGLMRDDLRTKNLIPLTEPYRNLGFSHGPGGGGEATTAAVLATTGNDAIVDWVFLELRNTTSQIVATRSALVQRDGDIVSSGDGISGVKFDVLPGDYYVVVKHRNHLAVMTDAKVTFGATAASVDFTAASLGIYNSDPAFDGTERRVLSGSTMGLWPGEANRDNQINYTGIARDLWAIKGQVYSDVGNTSNVPVYISSGYHTTDLDLKGSTIFQGGGSDSSVILSALLIHPQNIAGLPSFVLPGQVPIATILPQSLCSNISKVLLVQRITAVNGNSLKNPHDNTPLNLVIDDTTSPHKDDDNHVRWPANYLVGSINGGTLKSGDFVEYTLYFLNAGTVNVKNVRFCNRINPDQIFQPESYAPGVGIKLRLGNDPIIPLTSFRDGFDRTEFINAGQPVPTTCNLTAVNDRGTLLVDVTGNPNTGFPGLLEIPYATTAGTPNHSYGFFRFVVKITP